MLIENFPEQLLLFVQNALYLLHAIVEVRQQAIPGFHHFFGYADQHLAVFVGQSLDFQQVCDVLAQAYGLVLDHGLMLLEAQVLSG
ncbi:hypothetical protein D3C80_1902780 [compost metagenome]